MEKIFRKIILITGIAQSIGLGWSLGKNTSSASSVAVSQVSSASSQSSLSSSSSVSSNNPYGYVDPTHVVPVNPLKIALAYYDANKSTLGNTNYLSVADFTQYGNNKRLYVIDMRSGDVTQYLVAHGMGSDPNHTGYATIFSNVPGSNATSLGFYITSDAYDGDDGDSLVLNGMSETNSNALARYVVMHGATYVDPSYDPLGRSDGCLALEEGVVRSVINELLGGSVIYAYNATYSTEPVPAGFPTN